jgi:hypothetical protein
MRSEQMIKQRVASRPAARQDESAAPPTSHPPRERRLALSNLAHRAVVTFGERGHQRRTLINILILAQALLFLASAPGYLGGHPATLPLVALGFGVFVCLVAWILNQLFRDPGKAAYALVFGSSVAVLLQVFLAAASGNPVQASQTSLLLLAVILDAALLFSPEATLIAAGTAIALTIVALLLALALGNDLSRPETYALVEDTLGLLSVTGLIAWLLAQFVYDSAVEAQRARDLQFAQARLDALVTQSADQRRRIEGAATSLQQAIARAASGDFSMRASVAEGELSAVASGLNALLERLQGLGPRNLTRQQMDAGAPSWMDVSRGMGEGSTPTPGSMPLMGGAPLDAAAPEASLPRRLLRVQELAGEIVGALAHSQNGLNTMAETAAEALRTVGASLAAADGMLTGSQQGVELAARARRALIAMFPGDAARESRGEPRARDASGLDPSEAAALLGLGPDLGVGGPGMTGSFSMLGTFDLEPAGSTGASAAAEDMPPPPGLSAPVPSGGPKGDAQEQQDATAEDGTPAAAGKRRRGGRGAGDAKAPAPELVAELQQAIDQLHDEVVRQERTASTLTHDLGLANRNVRGVDIGVSWTRQALEAVRRNAERLYQTAGGNAPPSLAGDPGPASHPLPPDMPARVPTATRPLAERARIASGPLAADLGLGGSAIARSADAAGPAGERADGPGSPAGEQGS